MKQNNHFIRTGIILCSSLVCCISLSLPVWGAEQSPVSFEAPRSTIQTNVSLEAPSATGSSAKTVPGTVLSIKDSSDTGKQTGMKGKSLGIFETSGYCSCTLCCSDGWTHTYAGTVPKADHTISADLSLYPIGTRLMIGDVIYTVEDIGAAVNGNRIDIYYDSHEEAAAHGLKEQEVFAVNE